MENIGKQIEFFRKEKRMTQKDLADKLFVTSQTVSKWENNETNLPVDMLENIAEILEISIAQLFDEKAPKTKGSELLIAKTNQHPFRTPIHFTIYILMTLVFFILGFVFTFAKPLPAQIYCVFYIFGSLSFILMIYSGFLLSKFLKQAYLPALANDNKITFANSDKLNLKDIVTVKASRCYEKFIFRLFNSSVSAYTFGKLTIIKKDNKKIYLYYIENVEFIKNKLLEKINI